MKKSNYFIKNSFIFGLISLLMISCEKENTSIPLGFTAIGSPNSREAFIYYSENNPNTYLSLIGSFDTNHEIILLDKNGNIRKKYQMPISFGDRLYNNVAFIDNYLFIKERIGASGYNLNIVQFQLNDNEVTQPPFQYTNKLDSLYGIDSLSTKVNGLFSDKKKLFVLKNLPDTLGYPQKLILYSIDKLNNPNSSDISSIDTMNIKENFPNLASPTIEKVIKGKNAFYVIIQDFDYFDGIYIVKFGLENHQEGEKYILTNNSMEVFKTDFSELTLDNLSFYKDINDMVEVDDNHIAFTTKASDSNREYAYLATADLSAGNIIRTNNLNYKKLGPIASFDPDSLDANSFLMIPFLKKASDKDYFIIGQRSIDNANIIYKITINGKDISDNEWGAIDDNNEYNNISAVKNSNNKINSVVKRFNNDGYNFMGVQDFGDHSRTILMQLDNNGEYIEN
jgi:hypothetical protein